MGQSIGPTSKVGGSKKVCSMGGVRGIPGTEKLLEISVKTLRKFGKNRNTAQKWTKPRTVGMLGTKKADQFY